MNVAIITGASSGMGWEFTRQLDGSAEIDEFWLVARRGDKLEELCAGLTKARGRAFAIDLTDRAQLQTLFDALEAERPTVSWLVNNAGFGKIGALDTIDVETNLNMIDLNVRALTEITQRVLPYCGEGSKIVQLASVAGLLPLANFGVYAATKAYVVNLSDALARELRPRGITVTAVCPGPVQTEFLDVASTHGAKMDTPEFVMARPERVVARAIADARRGRMHSVYGGSVRAFAAVTGLIPRGLATWASEKIYKTE